MPHHMSWFDPSLTSQLAQLFTGFARRWDDEADQATPLRSCLLRERQRSTAVTDRNQPRSCRARTHVVGTAGTGWEHARVGVRGPRSVGTHNRGAGQVRWYRHGTRARGLQALRYQGYLGHDAIWKLRSRFTHPRMHSISTDYDVLKDAWRLATWYLELVLLHWFEYEGSYMSRLQPRWAGDVTEVPWLNEPG